MDGMGDLCRDTNQHRLKLEQESIEESAYGLRERLKRIGKT